MARIFSPDGINAPYVQVVGANSKVQVFPLSMLGPVFEVAEVGTLKMKGYEVWVMTGTPPNGLVPVQVFKSEGDSLIKALGGDVPK